MRFTRRTSKDIEGQLRAARPRGPEELLAGLARSAETPRRGRTGLGRATGRLVVLIAALAALASVGALGYAGALGKNVAHSVNVKVVEQQARQISTHSAVRNAARDQYSDLPAGKTPADVIATEQKMAQDALDAKQAAELAACRANPRCNVKTLTTKQAAQDKALAKAYDDVRAELPGLSAVQTLALGRILAAHIEWTQVLADGQAARRTLCAKPANKTKAQCKNLASREVTERSKLAALQKAELDAFLGV